MELAELELATSRPFFSKLLDPGVQKAEAQLRLKSPGLKGMASNRAPFWNILVSNSGQGPEVPVPAKQSLGRKQAAMKATCALPFLS